MWDVALAQTAPGQAAPSPLLNFLPLVLVFVVFYFLLILPQQKKARQHRQMLESLKKNDEVMTSGGIYGKVITLGENVVTLEVAPNVRIRVHRPQISTVVKAEKAPTKETKD
jgi:preprotein translocase subunit YajC